MNNRQKRKADAERHNMLRVEREAYAEDEARFPRLRVNNNSLRHARMWMSVAVSLSSYRT